MHTLYFWLSASQYPALQRGGAARGSLFVSPIKYRTELHYRVETFACASGPPASTESGPDVRTAAEQLQGALLRPGRTSHHAASVERASHLEC